MIKLNIRYANAPNSNYNDEAVGSFYEEVKLAMNKVKAKYLIVIGDFKAKVGKTGVQ